MGQNLEKNVVAGEKTEESPEDRSKWNLNIHHVGLSDSSFVYIFINTHIHMCVCIYLRYFIQDTADYNAYILCTSLKEKKLLSI